MRLCCFAARTTDEKLLKVSSSGGAFTELARVVIGHGGVVFGAAWEREPLRVVHKFVESEEALSELRGSKYVVSDLSNVYGQIRSFLAERREVLFVGTPCQTAAMRKVFGDNPNLILCALICMANAEPQMLQLYIKELENERQSKIKSISFRDNSDGWHFSKIQVEFENVEKSFRESLYENAYFKALEIYPRKVCLKCAFRSGKSCADLIIGDFWKIESGLPTWHDWKGTNAILIYTVRGKSLVEAADLRLESVKYECIVEGNPYLERQYVPDGRKNRRFERVYRTIGIKRGVQYAEGPWLYKTTMRIVRAMNRRLGKKCALQF